MTYTITVAAAGGKLSVTHSGDVPDGKYVVNGSENTHGHSLSVTRHKPDGSQVAHAAAHHSKEH